MKSLVTKLGGACLISMSLATSAVGDTQKELGGFNCPGGPSNIPVVVSAGGYFDGASCSYVNLYNVYDCT